MGRYKLTEIREPSTYVLDMVLWAHCPTCKKDWKPTKNPRYIKQCPLCSSRFRHSKPEGSENNE